MKYYTAKVNYKAKWYDKETDKEYYTILPKITLVNLLTSNDL